MNHVNPTRALSSLSALCALAGTLVLAGCGKVDPELTAQQMTMTDATCAPAEIGKIADADVRKAFQARCDRRSQLDPAAPARPAG